MENPSKMYHKKTCACGCGRVGRFHTYATNACRQRAYRNRKVEHIDIKAKTVSSWLIDMFGEDDCQPIFNHLNEVSGNKATKHIDDALEQLIYLFQARITKLEKKARRVS